MRALLQAEAGMMIRQLLTVVVLAVAAGCNPAGDAGPAHEAVLYLTGTDFSSWTEKTGDWEITGGASLEPGRPKRLSGEPGTGVLLNGKKGNTVDLVSRSEFGDCEAHVEFLLSKDSNSGVYLMGRYEIQIFDSWKKEGEYPGIECGGIYQRWDEKRDPKGYEGHSPEVNASRPPGEWQAFDVVFRAPKFDASGEKVQNACFVKVQHNGVLIHENVELTGPTRGSLFEHEASEGPLRLQGDHGPVAYRNVWIRTRSSESSPPDLSGEWTPLFDGRSLDGWSAKPGGKWEVRGGMIAGTSPASETRHGILLTEKRYGDFTARFKYRVLRGNSGFYFRADKTADAVSVHGFQAELDEKSDAGGLYETGGRAWVIRPDSASSGRWFRPGRWNDMTVSAEGRRIRVWVNGIQTAELLNDPGRPEGFIGLQLHGGMDMDVRFRDIQIRTP
jgi:hypothetical protein